MSTNLNLSCTILGNWYLHCTISFQLYITLMMVKNLKTTINNKVCITTDVFPFYVLLSKTSLVVMNMLIKHLTLDKVLGI